MFFCQVIIVLAYIMVVLTFPISIWYCFKVFKISQNDRQHRFLNLYFQVVNEYERAVIFRLGDLGLSDFEIFQQQI